MWRLLKEALAGDQPAGLARVRGFPESPAGLGRVCCGRVHARLAFGQDFQRPALGMRGKQLPSLGLQSSEGFQGQLPGIPNLSLAPYVLVTLRQVSQPHLRLPPGLMDRFC